MAPDASALQSWNDLVNINAGVLMIYHLSDNATVALIVDCDVDGFTSASIIGQYLQRYLPNITIDYYLHDGKAHGLEEHWEEIANKNYELVIVPDAGSNDKQYAEHISCPILVIDHHIVEIGPASNMTIINNQISPNYHNKNLSGAGMAYQFCRALDDRLGHHWADDYIDLAALGICADMMSGLELENQYIWHEGFKNIQNYFFLSIARKQAYSITGKVGATDEELLRALDPTSVAFYIVPLINAMVRVGTHDEKSRMLQAFLNGHQMVSSQKRGAKGELEELAIESTRECVNARTHQNKMKDDAVARIEQKIFKYDLLENKILFVELDEDDDFSPELNGLIANQLVSVYKHPTIVARLNDEGFIRGSIRGLSNSDMPPFKEFLDSTGLCEYVQGHSLAAGLSIPAANLPKLHEVANMALAQYNFNENYYEVNFSRRAEDGDLYSLILNLNNYKHVWSQQNPEALIHIHNLSISKSDIQILGKNKDTLKLVKNDIAFMKFFARDTIEELNKYDHVKLELVGRANLNVWCGRVTPQIFIDDIEIIPQTLLDF